MYETATSPAAWLVLAAPVAFAVVRIAAARQTEGRPVGAVVAGTVAGCCGVFVAAAAAFALTVGGTQQSTTVGADTWGVSVRLDPLSVTMLAMIALLALVIFRYSCTYLDGDPRQGI